jgi:hypothetical protein
MSDRFLEQRINVIATFIVTPRIIRYFAGTQGRRSNADPFVVTKSSRVTLSRNDYT